MSEDIDPLSSDKDGLLWPFLDVKRLTERPLMDGSDASFVALATCFPGIFFGVPPLLQMTCTLKILQEPVLFLP